MKLVLFDWNGTLIDDMPIWYESIKKIFAIHNAKPPTIEEYFRELETAKNYAEIYNKRGIVLGKDELDKIYQEEYKRYLPEIKLSPNVKKTISALNKNGIVLGIVSTQLVPLFEPLINRFGIKELFKHIYLEIQQKSTTILHICVQEKILPHECCYIGDAPSDIRNAKKAGVQALAYLNGYIPEELISAANPDFTISRFQELPKLIKNKKQ